MTERYVKHRDCARLAEQGRALASEREDLIASGIDPERLGIPLFYWCRCLDRPETIEEMGDWKHE